MSWIVQSDARIVNARRACEQMKDGHEDELNHYALKVHRFAQD
jgi:hypothetical protein